MTHKTNAQLIAVGDNCLDVYVDTQIMAVGGNALNVAVQWRRQGWNACYLGAVGQDLEGEILLEEIEKSGLQTVNIERRTGSTAVTLLSERDGDRRFLLEDLGVGEGYFPAKIHYAKLRDADWIHLGTNSNADLVKQLVADGLPFSIDVSTQLDALALNGVPLVFASGPEDPLVPIEPLINNLLRTGLKKLVITCGKRGAFYVDGTSQYAVNAQPIDVVDTCGAGDSFIARFIIAFCMNNSTPEAALDEATSAATITCQHKGGFPQELRSVPNRLVKKYAHVTANAKESLS